ncbi:DUF3011 domain-containing protein [Sphingobium phenoxybenzoativorans]|uniref:DUF3011 domain-containing protein n=1 Tax=Sphingobium phenoxybenzoativorans TaxID=1592790 RepID=A0A975Q276_9SPHN|nr:DUF3011 domain-containing protein [Sphingobium phenoxybenzoativorans]QUT06386.1 DUF3011 domain-containing protein [Sphingobium phenoxybenzoativorans]
MTRRFVSLTVMIALSATAITPLAAQTRPTPIEKPQILPVPGGPAVQPPRPTYPGGPVIQPPKPTYPQRPQPPGNNYGRTIRCESVRHKTERCAVRTENRVQLVRRLGGSCVQNRTWGFTKSNIWVSNGCSAEFAYGRWAGGGGQYPGNPYPDRPYPQPYPEKEKDKGPSTGAVIAGVAVAGGLIALLASNASKKKKEKEAAEAANAATPEPEAEAPATFPPGPPAALVADLSPLPAASRPSVQTCLYEAARQIGATGGTRLSYDKLTSLEQGNGGWRFGASLTATYPDGERTLPLYCRATPTKVIQLDFASGG